MPRCTHQTQEYRASRVPKKKVEKKQVSVLLKLYVSDNIDDVHGRHFLLARRIRMYTFRCSLCDPCFPRGRGRWHNRLCRD